ncbi:unnamed protein product [Spodoptera exigua]|nr:unnamed protein product [Spodoptera exigua]
MSQSVDVVDLISTLLDNEKYKEALNASHEKRLTAAYKDNCWDLISVIVGKIQDDSVTIKPSLYGTCEQLLSIIIEECAPEEALLEFIELLELAKNDAQFGIILPALQQILKKKSFKRGRSLEWCFNSISSYIENIAVSEHQLEGEERLLMDSDPNIRRIIRVYSLLPPFYRYFIDEIIQVDSTCNNNVHTKQIITAFLISLLGKPLIYIDMDPETNANSEARLNCSIIVKDICSLEKNILKFLVYLEASDRDSKKKPAKGNDMEEEKLPYEHEEKINLTTLSGLFYTVLSGHFQIPETAIPQVYSLEYILHTAMLSVIHLLNFPEYGPLTKALALCEVIVNRFPNRQSHELLSSSVHFRMCKGLFNVAIYSSYESIRKKSVALIGQQINKFDYKGRCALIKYLIEVSNHSGMIGYAITLYKSSLNEAFEDPCIDDCFRGPQLLNMLKKICYLPHGAESDLVELADQIITALNFLRYLALKDTKNLTGIRDCFSYIENNYLEQLRVGLNMSKAHYEVKLKDIEEGKNLPGSNINVSVNVGGNVLDKIPEENVKEMIYSALNAFHLIEGLIGRLCECININKMQQLQM